eukprot:s1_g2400.t1
MDGAERRTQQETREFLNYHFSMTSPLDRLTERLPVHVAAARFIWMMTANNRLADIAFYEPKVSAFTDDKLTVPGSSYGARLRQSQPGVDQVASIIGRLKEDPNTRRAAVSIYLPIDAHRESKDIPCAFGMFFHNRNGRLNTTIVMRSNNAWSLLPFNVFEFSMLAEVVAVEVGLELGNINYFAGSMHLYERDVLKVEDFLRQIPKVQGRMPKMPKDPKPLEELGKLGVLEAELRHKSEAINGRTMGEWVEKIVGTFAPYWAQFGLLLLTSIAARNDDGGLEQVIGHLNPEFKSLVPQKAETSGNKSTAAPSGPLFGEATNSSVLSFERAAVASRFKELMIEHEQSNGPEGAEVVLNALDVVQEQIAARGGREPLTRERLAPLARHLGADISYGNDLRSAGEEASLKKTDSGVVLSVSRDSFEDPRTRNRARFSIAHEIGHLLLFRLMGPEFLEHSDANKQAYTLTEQLCDYAASNLLMPRAFLSDAIRQRGFTSLGMRAVAELFDVSMPALLRATAELVPNGAVLEWRRYRRRRGERMEWRVLRTYSSSRADRSSSWLPEGCTLKHIADLGDPDDFVLDHTEVRRSIVLIIGRSHKSRDAIVCRWPSTAPEEQLDMALEHESPSKKYEYDRVAGRLMMLVGDVGRVDDIQFGVGRPNEDLHLRSAKRV